MFINGLFLCGRRQKLNVYIRHHQGAKCARRALVTGFITNYHTAPLSTRSMGKTLTSCENCQYLCSMMVLVCHFTVTLLYFSHQKVFTAE